MYQAKFRPWLIPVIVTLLALVFLVDCFSPRGTFDYVFFFIPVALSFLHHHTRFPIQIASIATMLSLLGFWMSPQPAHVEFHQALLNRIYSLITLWGIGLLVRQIISARVVVEKTAWLKNEAVELAKRTRGELTALEVGEQLVTRLAEVTKASVGALFLKHEKKDVLIFQNGFAYQPETEISIPFGSNITGQAAKEKKFITVTGPDHLPIASATMKHNPSHVIALPLIADNEVVGVLELGFFSPPKQLATELLELIAEPAAISIRSAQHKAKLSDLLQETQQFAEELQAQQEELRVANEELEQQTRALKESHQKLENQQAEMEQTNQQLEEQAQILEHQKNLLDERNRDLTYAQHNLEEKALELQKSGNYKSEFLANMSHELRTPLNSTLILAKLLSDNKPGNLNEEQVKYAQIIYNSGQDLLNLINDILDLSKVEAGKMTLNPEIVFIRHVLKNIDATFAIIAKEKKIDFKIHIDDDVVNQITTDRQRLEQILRNFLSNAFKFTTQGGISIHVYTAPKGIAFAVADTGVGISPDQQTVIFEAFRQADGTISRKFGGTGLGLSISRELARVLGGEIQLSSTKGEGSTFTLILPREFGLKTEIEHKVEVKAKPEVLPPVRERETEKVTFSFADDRDILDRYNRKMLIIEDDEHFAKILFDLAHEMSFGAVVSPTAHDGMELAQKYSPHAIVLDVRLPDHSGMIVLDHLKMNTKTRHIPVHVISSEDFSKSALEMGAAGYMLKPVKRERLQSAFQNITSHLEQKMRAVLIIEDDEIQRQHIMGLIQDKHVEVDAVDSSEKALEKLKTKTYDCMIMDLSLPGMSGYELLAQISNENSVYAFPPVIVYTARDLTREEEEKLRLYSGSIIIKGAKSPERLLSEVTLFLHRVETDLPPERQKMLRELRSRDKNLEGRRILVVDDDVRNIFALTSALEEQGAKIESARNGREALEVLESNGNVDLVLMDIMMPEMDGYEAMRRIRQTKKYNDLPIISLTAKAMKDDKKKCIEAGANDYLPKPIQMDKLLSLLRVWLPAHQRFIH